MVEKEPTRCSMLFAFRREMEARRLKGTWLVNTLGLKNGVGGGEKTPSFSPFPSSFDVTEWWGERLTDQHLGRRWRWASWRRDVVSVR